MSDDRDLIIDGLLGELADLRAQAAAAAWRHDGLMAALRSELDRSRDFVEKVDAWAVRMTECARAVGEESNRVPFPIGCKWIPVHS